MPRWREIHRVLKPGGVAAQHLSRARRVARGAHRHSLRAPAPARLARCASAIPGRCARWAWAPGRSRRPTRASGPRDKLAWIDAYTHYRTRTEIFRAFGRYFRNELREAEYIRYRLRDAPWRAPLARLLDLPRRVRPAAALFRKLAFLVIVSRKDAR